MTMRRRREALDPTGRTRETGRAEGAGGRGGMQRDGLPRVAAEGEGAAP